MKLRHMLAAACAAVAAVLAPCALAQESSPFDDLGLEAIADDDLAGLRGGILYAGGIAFDFGAVVRTTIDGQPALETRLTWTPDGMMIEDLSALQGMQLPGGGFGLDLSDATGRTLVGHRLLDGELQGFILNSGDNRNIRQDVEISLVLPGFDVVQQGIRDGRLSAGINLDMAEGLLRSGLD